MFESFKFNIAQEQGMKADDKDDDNQSLKGQDLEFSDDDSDKEAEEVKNEPVKNNGFSNYKF